MVARPAWHCKHGGGYGLHPSALPSSLAQMGRGRVRLENEQLAMAAHARCHSAVVSPYPWRHNGINDEYRQSLFLFRTGIEPCGREPFVLLHRERRS